MTFFEVVPYKDYVEGRVFFKEGSLLVQTPGVRYGPEEVEIPYPQLVEELLKAEARGFEPVVNMLAQLRQLDKG